MKSRITSLLFAVATAGAAGSASATPLDDRASIAVFATAGNEMPGRMNDVFGGSMSEPGADGTVVYKKFDFQDAYAHAPSLGAEFAYAFNERLAAFGRAAYLGFNGRQHELGSFIEAESGPNLPIHADFEDTRARGLDLGARYSFAPGSRLRPFVGAELGSEWLDAQRVTLNNFDGNGATAVQLMPKSTVFQQRVETGLTYSPATNFDVRLTAAASHFDSPGRSTDPNLAMVGLASALEPPRGHWDYPAELGAVWHF